MSNHTSNHTELPFGYELPDMNGHPPPPEHHLLDDKTAESLSNFFSNPDNFHSADALTGLDMLQANTNGADLTSHDMNDPAIMGFSTVNHGIPTPTGAHPGDIHGLPYTDHHSGHMAPHYDGHDQPFYNETTDDVIQGATALVRNNGHIELTQLSGREGIYSPHLMRQNSHPSPQYAFSVPHTQGMPVSTTPVSAPSRMHPFLGSPVTQGYGYAVNSPTSPSFHGSPSYHNHAQGSYTPIHTPTFPDPATMHYMASMQHRSAANGYIPQRPPHFQFGSDNNFSPNGYSLPLGQPTFQDTEGRVLSDVNYALQANPSTANSTMPSSPVYDRHSHRRKSSMAQSPINNVKSKVEDEYSSGGESPPARPTKRRKNTDPAEELDDTESSGDEDEDEQYAKLRKSKGFKGHGRKDSKSTRASRRAAAKQKGRENLSEEQKRSNHIASEQKRRNLIRVGFEELNELVPALRNACHSKATALQETALFLEWLEAGNAELRAKVEAMEAAHGPTD